MINENNPLVSSGGKKRFFHFRTSPSLAFIPSPSVASDIRKFPSLSEFVALSISFVPKTTPTAKPQPQPTPTPQPEPLVQPDKPTEKPEPNEPKYGQDVYNTLKTKIKDVNGEKVLSRQDYESAVKDLYNKKEGEWKNYQRQISGNERPGEGTRQRFDKSSRSELDALISQDNVKLNDENQTNPTPENLSETIRRFKILINS